MKWNDFIAPNMGLLVYKSLYKEEAIKSKVMYELPRGTEKEKLFIDISKEAKETTPFDSFYKALFDKDLKDYQQIENDAAINRFDIKTTYPGLICGTGYTHDSNVIGDIKVGFYFDHTTGQPIIPGSSIKGVLKSIFEDENDKTDATSLDAFRFIINEIIESKENTETEEWIKLLDAFNDDKESLILLKKAKENIFGTQEKEGEDVFFDAVIFIEKTGMDNKFLASDFITPHPDPLKNPTPLMFLKVRSNVSFEFRFCLKTFEINNEPIISANQKERIFKQIILTLGLGAKTNVGYGQFK